MWNTQGGERKLKGRGFNKIREGELIEDLLTNLEFTYCFNVFVLCTEIE